MKRKRHTPEEIIRKLRTAEEAMASGRTAEEACRIMAVGGLPHGNPVPATAVCGVTSYVKAGT
jgi:hypothetical protein